MNGNQPIYCFLNAGLREITKSRSGGERWTRAVATMDRAAPTIVGPSSVTVHFYLFFVIASPSIYQLVSFESWPQDKRIFFPLREA